MRLSTFFFLSIALLSLPLITSGQVRSVPSVYGTIQAAIDSASDGDTVLVAPGTYVENINFRGKKITVASWFILFHNPTYIESTTIDGSSPADPDTSSVVLMVNGEDPSSVLEGFTLTGGTGTVWQDIHNTQFYREGGGILCELSSPTIRHNIIRDNEAVDLSGVVSAGGGAIRIGDGNPTVENNIITGNRGRYGAGIVLNYTGATIRNNVIYGNSGGSDFGGGGVWAVANGPAQKILENNTIVENSSTTYGGGVYVWNTSMTIRNSIIWGNEAPTQAQIGTASSTVTVSFSDVEGGWAGTGNIDAGPLFSDTSHYLSDSSPCIDAGDSGLAYNDPPGAPPSGPADWPSRGTVRNDMGAYGGPLTRPAPYYDLHLNDPRPPTGFTAYSDYLTPTSVVLTWTDPIELNNGQPLSAFVLHLYRGTDFIAAVDSGVEMYNFNDPSLVLHDHYTFYIKTVIAADSSVGDSAGVYAGGHRQPGAVSGFRVTDRTEGVELSWINPSGQFDGTPLNDFAAVVIYRDGAVFDSLAQSATDTGGARGYVDSSEGYHWYKIQTHDDEVPPNYSVLTDSILGFGGLLDAWSEDFESGTGSMYLDGPWDTTRAIGFNSGSSLTESPDGNYPDGAYFTCLTPRVVVLPGMTFSFKHIAIILTLDFGYVEITNNQGASYAVLRAFNSFAHPEWRDSSADSGDWFTESFDLGAYAGDTIGFRFRFQSNASNNADGWFIDDIQIGIPVAVDDGPTEGVPDRFSLEQNFPNPFNPLTEIRYALPATGHVRLSVSDVLGREVAVLVDRIQAAGNRSVIFDGGALASGVYTYRLTAGASTGTMKMLLLR